MRNAIIVVLLGVGTLGCGPLVGPLGDGEEGTATGTTTTHGANTAPIDAATGGSTSGDPSGGPAMTSGSLVGSTSSDSGDDPFETSGGTSLDLPSPAVEADCDFWPEGEGPTPLWCRTLVPEDADGARAERVAVGPGGEIYVSGHAQDGLFETEWKHGLVVRYAPDGARQWTQVLEHGPVGFDDAWGIAVLDGGDVVVGGNGATDAFAEHGWLARLTPSGDPVWDLDQPMMAYPRRIAATADGGFVVVGGEPYDGIVEPPARITRHAADGSLTWHYGPDAMAMYSENTGRAVGLDAAGSVYVAVTLSSRTRMLAKLSPAGGVLWEHPMPPDDPTQWNVASDLVVTPAGDVLVTGYVDDQAWLARFTTDGMEAWSQFIDAPDGGHAGLETLALLPGGDVVAGGWQTSADFQDGWLWLRRVGPDGALVWDVTVPDLSVLGTTLEDLAVTPEGDVVMVGSSSGVFYPYVWVARVQP